MNGTPPRAGCILITNRYGDAVDVVQHYNEQYNEQSIINYFMRYCQFMDLEEPGDPPHSAWRWKTFNHEIPRGRNPNYPFVSDGIYTGWGWKEVVQSSAG